VFCSRHFVNDTGKSLNMHFSVTAGFVSRAEREGSRASCCHRTGGNGRNRSFSMIPAIHGLQHAL